MGLTSTEIRTIHNRQYGYEHFWDPVLKERRTRYLGPVHNGHAVVNTTFRLENCDFRALEVPQDSVDLILTDPPYGDQALDLWEPLSALGRRVLRPGGLLVAYAGHRSLPKVLSALGAHLDFVWESAVVHQGATTRVHFARVMVGWRPVLIFNKPPLRQNRYWKDILLFRHREKDDHAWQQNLEEARQIIRDFTERGGTVLDPMMGSGTVAIAARGQGRSFVGCDIDPTAVAVCRERVARELGLPDVNIPDQES